MEDQHFLESLAERLRGSATVEAVYGQPIHAEGRTVIPIARVAYGFGGGSGEGHGAEQAGKSGTGSGMGGGGAVRAVPAGVVELTHTGTRFVPVGLASKLLAVGAVGLSLGFLLGRRTRNGHPTRRHLPRFLQ
jgi:uncharacterized spore protein YtfJ